jgi:serine/threonine protein kinase/tetratricopeptide (TPR) repeat protein
MTESPDLTESVFAAAVALADPAERAAYLDQACANNPALRARIDALLRAHDRAGHLLDRPAAVSGESTAAYISTGEQAGTIIAGRYKLLEAIGEGGMGTVWAAEQTEPVRRKVALKLIKPGMDSRQVLARFEAERQALALMDHPSIARVLDGGLTEAGRPFFVMDYVKGVPITQYCDETRLSVSERLALFVQVCQAVQHAHQKGIIHRDLKPSNILVALYDDRPVPKVIDFGLAKAMYQPLTDQTLHTAHETVLGTPLYMSPEQAQVNNLDVDTRTDVYALGVLLYELLTGTTPLERQRFKEAAWEEIRRIIREEEPQRPSARLSSIDTLPSLAACRQTEPARLTRLVRGELDWIAMKALEKDRNRRYDTANGFAMDLQRFLAGEPVQAAPPSASYRLRKLARKYRAVLATAAVIALLLVGGIAVSTWQAVRATKAEAQAQKRLAQIEKSNDIITSIFADLDIEEVKQGTEPLEVVLGQRLLKAASDLEGEAVGDPLVVAGLQHRLGDSLLHLGMAKEAISLFDKARNTRANILGPEHQDTLKSMNELGDAYRVDGKLDLALPLLEETLKLRKARLGADHPDTLESMNDLGMAFGHAGKLDQSVGLLEETVKLRKAKLGVDHTETLLSMNNLALAYHRAGKLNPAMELDEAILKILKSKLGPDRPRTLASMHNLAADYQALGKLDQALPLLEETLKLQKIRLGADHPNTLLSMNNLASVYQDAGKLDQGLPLFEETLKLTKAKLGADHPNTLVSMNNLAGAYQHAGKLNQALPLYEETHKLLKIKLGADHPNTIVSMNNLAMAYQDASKLDRALPLLEEALKMSKAKLGADHPNTITSMNNLAMAYQRAGKLGRALPLFEETLKLSKAKQGADHPNTLASMGNLALGYRDAGKLDRALPLFQEAARGMEKIHFRHQTAGWIVNCAIGSQEQLQQFDQAEAWRRRWLAVIKERAGADSPAYAAELAGLGSNLLQQKRWTDAEAATRECLAIRQKKEPDAWTTFNTQSMLGQALLMQKQYAEAEKLLLSGYEGMQQRAAKIPAQLRKVRLTETLEHIVQVSEAAGKKSEADKWRKKLEEAKKVEGK